MELARPCGHSWAAVVSASSLFLAIHLRAPGVAWLDRSRRKRRLEIGGPAGGLAGKSSREKYRIVAFGSIFLGEKTLNDSSFYFSLSHYHSFCSIDSRFSFGSGQFTY